MRALLALARRDRFTFLSHRFQLALKGGLFLAWILTFVFLARLVDASSPAVAEQVAGDYFTFALMGLAFLRISQVCLTQMAGTLREEQLQGTVEPMLATGLPPRLFALGGLLWPLLSEGSVLVLLFGSAMVLHGSELALTQLPIALVALAATIVAMTLWGMLSAACVIAFQRGDPVALLFNLLAIGLSGAFFPVDMVPEWLRPLAHLLPLTWGLAAARAALLRGAGWSAPEVVQALTMLALSIAILLPLALFSLRLAFRRARRVGSLAHA